MLPWQTGPNRHFCLASLFIFTKVYQICIIKNPVNLRGHQELHRLRIILDFTCIQRNTYQKYIKN